MTQAAFKLPSASRSLILIAPGYALLATLFLYMGMSAERLTHDPDPTHLLLSWGYGLPQPLYGRTIYMAPQINDVQEWCEGLGFVLATLVISLLTRRSKSLIVEIAMVLEAYILYQGLVLYSPYAFPALSERLIDTSFTLTISMMSYIVLPLVFAIRYLFSRSMRANVESLPS